MSLKKIAEMVGTSPSTVSRVLNDSHTKCASKGLKDKIWQAAQEIHYVPNTAARDLKLGHTGKKKVLRISIVLARVGSLDEDPFFRELYQGLEYEILKKGFVVDGLVTADEKDGQTLKKCDGMVILGRCSPRSLRTLSKHTPNMVGIWRNPMNYEIDEVV